MLIDDMPACREMDALVAQEVKRWRDIRWLEDGVAMKGPWGYSPDYRSEMAVPFYSDLIAATWEVVEEMRRRLFVLELYQAVSSDEWHAKFWVHIDIRDSLDPVPGGSAYAPTAPLAICRAALKAVGVNEV